MKVTPAINTGTIKKSAAPIVTAPDQIKNQTLRGLSTIPQIKMNYNHFLKITINTINLVELWTKLNRTKKTAFFNQRTE